LASALESPSIALLPILSILAYYHIKASEGVLAKGTLLYTSNKTSNAGTKLFLDSSFYDVGAKLSDMALVHTY
jgi:hypothetical protein